MNLGGKVWEKWGEGWGCFQVMYCRQLSVLWQDLG
jgi:hypothetical protein